jgi:hypothetical protein
VFPLKRMKEYRVLQRQMEDLVEIPHYKYPLRNPPPSPCIRLRNLEFIIILVLDKTLTIAYFADPSKNRHSLCTHYPVAFLILDHGPSLNQRRRRKFLLHFFSSRRWNSRRCSRRGGSINCSRGICMVQSQDKEKSGEYVRGGNEL